MTSSTNGGNPRKSTRILVVRNDKVGDFMLAWPALACLKAAAPALHISVLVPTYTAPLARLCPWIDEVILDPGGDAGRDEQHSLLARIREGRFAALLTLYSTTRIGWLGWRAGIPCRVAPATKWAQLFYNHRVVQRRSHSAKPEFEYNLELAESLLDTMGCRPGPRPVPPFWPLTNDERRTQRYRLAEELDLDPTCPWIFLHGGSGGSAVNLSANQYANLARGVDRQLKGYRRPIWILTAGPGEEATAEAIREPLLESGITAYRLPPKANLGEFAMSLAAADLFISGSTGPLHVAGCLDIATAGFYPAHRSATPLRWQTCNRDEHRLAFCPPAEAGERNMASIDITTAAGSIANLLKYKILREPSP